MGVVGAGTGGGTGAVGVGGGYVGYVGAGGVGADGGFPMYVPAQFPSQLLLLSLHQVGPQLCPPFQVQQPPPAGVGPVTGA